MLSSTVCASQSLWLMASASWMEMTGSFSCSSHAHMSPVRTKGSRSMHSLSHAPPWFSSPCTQFSTFIFTSNGISLNQVIATITCQVSTLFLCSSCPSRNRSTARACATSNLLPSRDSSDCRVMKGTSDCSSSLS